MAYYTGTMPITATPALDMAAILHSLLTGNGYTHVEDWTSGAETVRIYKSALAANGVGDWYLYLRRTSDAMTGLQFTVSEAWDAINKKIQRYAPSGASVAPNPAASYTVNDVAGQLPNVTGSIKYLTLDTAAASTNATSYWLSVNASRLVIGTRNSSLDSGVYAGLGDEIMPSTVGGSGMPLGIFSNSTYGYATREPNQVSGASGNFGAPTGSWGVLPSNIDFYTARYYAALPTASSGRVSGSGSPRFTLKDMLHVNGLGQVNGDTITVGSKTYTRVGTSAPYYVDQAA